MSSRASPESNRRSSRLYYARNREEQRARRNERARASGRKKVPDPYKDEARSRLNAAVRSGKIVKPAHCEGCGTAAATLHGHHDDYSKPLDVRWLCAPCHAAVHAPERRASEGMEARLSGPQWRLFDKLSRLPPHEWLYGDAEHKSVVRALVEKGLISTWPTVEGNILLRAVTDQQGQER